MNEIRPARPDEILAYYAKRILMHHVAVVDGKPVAMAGVARDAGQLWGFLDMAGDVPKALGLGIVRALRRGLDTVSEPVYVQCAGDKRAERLLFAIGFRPTDNVRGNYRVWARNNG